MVTFLQEQRMNFNFTVMKTFVVLVNPMYLLHVRVHYRLQPVPTPSSLSRTQKRIQMR